jgi:hypothetical protein
MGGCEGVRMNKVRWAHWRTWQWTLCDNTISLLKDGMWFRLERWKQQGYWITWSTDKTFGEKFGYEEAVWQIGKGIRFRIACFKLETPGWYYERKEEA